MFAGCGAPLPPYSLEIARLSPCVVWLASSGLYLSPKIDLACLVIDEILLCESAESTGYYPSGLWTSGYSKVAHEYNKMDFGDSASQTPSCLGTECDSIMQLFDRATLRSC